MVQFFVPIFCSMADKMVEKIAADNSDGKEFDIVHYIERGSIEMIFASSFDAYTEDTEDGDETVNRIIECVKT